MGLFLGTRPQNFLPQSMVESPRSVATVTLAVPQAGGLADDLGFGVGWGGACGPGRLPPTPDSAHRGAGQSGHRQRAEGTSWEHSDINRIFFKENFFFKFLL